MRAREREAEALPQRRTQAAHGSLHLGCTSSTTAASLLTHYVAFSKSSTFPRSHTRFTGAAAIITAHEGEGNVDRIVSSNFPGVNKKKQAGPKNGNKRHNLWGSFFSFFFFSLGSASDVCFPQDMISVERGNNIVSRYCKCFCFKYGVGLYCLLLMLTDLCAMVKNGSWTVFIRNFFGTFISFRQDQNDD